MTINKITLGRKAVWRGRMTTGVLTVWTESGSNAQGCRSSLVSPNPSWAIRVSSPSRIHFCSPLELNSAVKWRRCAGGSDSWGWLRVWGRGGQAAGASARPGWVLGDPARLWKWPYQLPATLEEEQGLPQQWRVTGCRAGTHSLAQQGAPGRRELKFGCWLDRGAPARVWQVKHTGVPSLAWHNHRAALCWSWPEALPGRRGGSASWWLQGPSVTNQLELKNLTL